MLKSSFWPKCTIQWLNHFVETDSECVSICECYCQHGCFSTSMCITLKVKCLFLSIKLITGYDLTCLKNCHNYLSPGVLNLAGISTWFDAVLMINERNIQISAVWSSLLNRIYCWLIFTAVFSKYYYLQLIIKIFQDTCNISYQAPATLCGHSLMFAMDK